ncbi:MAG: hypothetical protein AAF850_03400 [Pseudomonadota bacterium]
MLKRSTINALFLAAASLAFSSLIFFSPSLARGGAPSDAGVAAYQEGDFELAWSLLLPLAENGHYRAQRIVAFMLLRNVGPIDCSGDNEASCGARATAYLIDAATRGDNNALLVLEGMRSSDAPYAPSDDVLDEIDIARAKKGDPMSSWRLVREAQNGNGDAAPADVLRWLKTAARADPSIYPYAVDAAFSLCEAYAGGLDGVAINRKRALRWCTRAARDGHVGAAALRPQLKGLGS